MPKNKFIDKKNAESFRVVHRSQRDLEKLENDDEASNLVLTPLKTDSKNEGPKIDLPKEVLPGKEVQDVKIPFMPRPELFMEVDEEVERALENPDEEDWEELDDDFVAQANKEAPNYNFSPKRRTQQDIWEDNEDDDDDEYYEDEEREEDPNDWDEDIDEEAAKYLKNPPKRFLEKWKRDGQFADAEHPIQKTEKVDLNTIKDESRKMLEARFEKTLNMYDDDEIGELDDHDPNVHGRSDINLFEDVLDDFIHKSTKFTLNDFTTEELANTSVRSVKQKTLIIPSIGHWDEVHEKHRKKNQQLEDEDDEEENLDDIDDYQPGTHDEPNFEDDEEDDDEEEEPIKHQHRQFDDAEEEDPEKKIEDINKAALKTHHTEADLERFVLDSDSEGEQKEWITIHQEDEHWDCQSILSTYSNTDNHPKLIVEEGTGQKIKLSQKTGLPVGVIKGKKQEKEKKSAADLGAPRPKGETKDEKKLRKQQVKQQKQQSREKKKMLKMAFKNEELNQKYLMQQVPPPTIKL